MDRRQFLSSTAAATGVAFASTASAQTQAQAAGEDGKLRVVLDKIFYANIDDSPQGATSLGLDKGPRAALKSRLDDRSAAFRVSRIAHAKAHLAELKGIDRTKLTGLSPVDYDVVAYQLETTIAGERFSYGATGGRYAPYAISQLTGAYQEVPDFLDGQHKVETGADADAYLARLKGFAVALDQDLERTRADAAKGVMCPDFNLDTTLAQLKALRGAPAARTVLVESLGRKAKAAKLGDGYAASAEKIVAAEVFPALDRQIASVEALRAKAGGQAGAWKLPDGEAYYAAALASATTTRLTPAEVHQMGVEQVADITARIDAILKVQGLTQGTAPQRLAALNDDPKQLYANTDEGRAELLAQLNRQIADFYPLLPRAFRTLPKAKVEVKRVPPFIQDGAANGYYQRAALDGSRPASYFINLKDTHDWPKFSLATLTYHEAIPGHHLQISLQQESGLIPLIRRTGGFSAFSEGWALYAEQLADELGVYDNDPLGKAGFLQSFLFRAARLVVDTGMHYKRWTREQATDYMVGVTGYARGRTQREIDRYVVWPGQACSYKVGHTVWAGQREKAKAALGARFDIRDFHDAALLPGSMPLTVLERVIGDWTKTRA